MSRSFHHTLPANKGNERPQHVLFADVESKLVAGPNHTTVFKPFLWTCYYKRYRTDNKPNQLDFFWGQDSDSFWDIVDAHTWAKKKTYLATHHLEVDFMPLAGFTSLLKRGWTLNKFISNGRTLLLFYSKGLRRLTILNNGSLFDSSIEDWGKMFNLPKLKMPDENDPIADWVTYCKRDTEIVVKMWDNLLEFLDENNLGNFKLTKAALAINAFKHRFMTHSIAIHNDAKTTVLERRAYHGGRFEALQLGTYTDGPYYELDVNSMYGFIESWAPLPTELRGYTIWPSIPMLKLRLTQYDVVATVDVDVKEPVYPVIEKGHVYFRTGLQRLTLCTPELRYALKRNWIVRVLRMAWYYKAPILKAYALFFMGLKRKYELEHNAPMRTLAKKYTNAVYGKLAQRGFEDNIIGECDPGTIEVAEIMNAQSGEKDALYKYGGKIHRVKTTLKSRDSFIAIAAHITAYARMYLWRLMQIAGTEHVLHVATDSLVVDRVGYENLKRLVHPNKPGTLKIEGVYQEYTVKGINDVVMDGERKIKGIGKNSVQIDDNTFVITAWPKITTLMKDGVLDHYYVRQVQKTLQRKEYYAMLGTPNPNLPVKPRKQSVFDLLGPDDQQALYETYAQIAALRSAKKLPQTTIFRVWDYRNGTWRRIRNNHGQLVPIEHSETWGNLSELGFETLRDFQSAVLTQLTIDAQIRKQKDLASRILAQVNR